VRLAVWAPLVASTLLALLSPPLTRRLPPRHATWALLCAGVLAVAGWAATLALLAFTGFGQIPLVAFLGSWSTRVLHAGDPLPPSVAVACALVLAAMLVALGVASWRRGSELVRAYQECHQLPGDGELAVVDDDRVEAFALPGLPALPEWSGLAGLPGAGGRIVVSTGMLGGLRAAEREALLAHERSHLRHHHHFFLLVFQIASATCPLLRPLAREGAYTVERWADEDAAEAVGDRSVVARAVARAALARSAAGGGPTGTRDGARGGPPPTALLAATGGPVPRRVQALLSPRPRLRRAPLVALVLLLALSGVSLGLAEQTTERLFEHARSVRAQLSDPTATNAPPPDATR